MDATLASIVAAAAPLVYAAVGETITERGGVVNLSLDGSILLSAMTGFVVASRTNSIMAGFAAAALASAIVAVIVAWSGISLNLNQVAVGFVLFILAGNLSAFLGDDYTRIPGPTVQARPIPVLSDIPVVGQALFDQNITVYGSLILIVTAAWFIARSRRGLELRAVGERPEAAHARGINVNRYRYLAAVVGGGLVGNWRSGLFVRPEGRMGRRRHDRVRMDSTGDRDLRWLAALAGGDGMLSLRCPSSGRPTPPTGLPRTVADFAVPTIPTDDHDFGRR